VEKRPEDFFHGLLPVLTRDEPHGYMRLASRHFSRSFASKM